MQTHALEAQQAQAPVEAQLVERGGEDFWIMAISRGVDVKVKANDIVTNHVRCLKQWIIDSGAQTHVVRLLVAQLFLGDLKPSRAIELRGAGGHQLDIYGSVEMLMINYERPKVPLASRNC